MLSADSRGRDLDSSLVGMGAYVGEDPMPAPGSIFGTAWASYTPASGSDCSMFPFADPMRAPAHCPKERADQYRMPFDFRDTFV
jgi:hypothetical protein